MAAFARPPSPPAIVVPQAVQVVVDEGGGCTDTAAFERAFFARSRRARGSGAANEASLHVTIDRGPQGLRGRVVLTSPPESPLERVVTGARCEDVALLSCLSRPFSPTKKGGAPRAAKKERSTPLTFRPMR